MSQKLLSERFAFTSGRVGGTPDAPVIEGVLLCGAVSRNRRRYLKEAFAGDKVQRYNGVPVKVTLKHGEANTLYQEQIGIVQNARLRADGMPVGDLAINPKKPYAEAFLWDAQHQPKACGMSHVATCKTRRGSDGWDEVTDIAEAVSVDVIGAGMAATTQSLFESKRSRAMKFSLKTFGESFGPKWGPKKWGAFVKLCEDIGDVADAPVMDDMPPGEDGGGDLKTALMSALAPMLDEAFESGSADALISAIKDFVKLHAKHTGQKPAEPVEADEDEDDKPFPESRKPLDPWLVLKECRAECGPDFTPGDGLLKALSGMRDEGDRKALLAEHRAAGKAAKESPLSGRPRFTPGTKTLAESKVPPTTAKDFAAAMRE